MSRQETTIFASLGGVRRCGGQAFFDKCLSLHSRMAASSHVPPMNIKAAVLKFVVLKPPFGVRYSLGLVDKQPPSNGFLYAVSIGVFASVIHFYDTYTINTGALTVNSVSVIS